MCSFITQAILHFVDFGQLWAIKTLKHIDKTPTTSRLKSHEILIQVHLLLYYNILLLFALWLATRHQDKQDKKMDVKHWKRNYECGM